MVAAIRSFTVVINGPEATAGSIFIFLKSMGISVPPRLEHIIAISSDAPIQAPYARQLR